MFERILKVKYLRCKNCFCYLASYNSFEIAKYVKITYADEQVAYLSVDNSITNIPKDSIGISSIYAKALGIEENDTVVMLEIHKPPSVRSLSITPTCQSDYEVLALLAQNVQSTLLDQIRVVHSDQNIIIWIGRNIFVKVPVSEVTPISPGCVNNFTEVVIKSPQNPDKMPEKSKTSTTKNAKKPLKPLVHNANNQAELDQNIFKYYMKLISGLTLDQILCKQMDKYTKSRSNLVFRGIPSKNQPNLDSIEKYLHPFNVFVSGSKVPQSWKSSSSKEKPIVCLMSLLTSDNFPPNPLYVRLCILEDYLDNVKVHPHNMFVSQTIFEHFGCTVGARFVLKHEAAETSVHELHIFGKRNYLVNKKELIQKFMADRTEGQVLLLNPEVVMTIESMKIMLKFSPVDAKFCLVDDKFVRDCKLTAIDEHVRVKEASLEEPPVDHTLEASNYQLIVDGVLTGFNLEKVESFENVLLTGKPGTGKTTLTRVVKEKLASHPYFIHTETINCKKIKGKTLDSLMKLCSNVYANLVLHQPSVLILEDLHILCENVPGEDMAPNAIYFNRVSEALHNLLQTFSKNKLIGIIATTISTLKLNNNIYSSRGSHLFKNIYNINGLDKSDRIKLVQYLFSKYSLQSVDFDALATKTEGFVVQDLANFVNKTVYEAYKDEINCDQKDPTITNDHCEQGLKTTCVLSLHDVQLHSPGNRDFSDVGGLGDVKKTLVESLLWPAQYPSIFTEAPLRLQSGLLLYGPPGTGKTILAGAAAKQCGLRLISIKGPELLSKYIGASEQAVRDVFDKAQSARPCILFFDEFDSLAPRRGQDTTGVTDRVVNQLLTQLDGVESLTGVCVLAATSRPDLLDPALLRPGRLDKQLLCPLPDLKSRLEILQALSKTLNLDSNVTLSKIAEKTEHFSGADLQSILYTAQLSSVDFLLNENGPIKNVTPKITQKHLEEALHKTRPSLTAQEKAKYDRIYARFQGGYKEDFKAGTKATLA